MHHKPLPTDHCAEGICSAILDDLWHEPARSSSGMGICTDTEAILIASSTSKCKSGKVRLPDTGVLRFAQERQATIEFFCFTFQGQKSCLNYLKNTYVLAPVLPDNAGEAHPE
jgi:hypothetical protein